MNVALRDVHEGLGCENPGKKWGSLIEALTGLTSGNDAATVGAVGDAVVSMGLPGSAVQWLGSLRLLGVLDNEDHLNSARAAEVAIALEMVGDSFFFSGPRETWTAVATLPHDVRPLLEPPPLRQTAGVLLGLIDRSVRSITLATPYVDAAAVDFLRDSIASAMRRGVAVTCLTSRDRGDEFVPFVTDALRIPVARLTVTELVTDVSTLGSHAKVLLVDGMRGYVGSANLTAAGLGRHVEIGVELLGDQVTELVNLFGALGRLGSDLFDVADGRLRV